MKHAILISVSAMFVLACTAPQTETMQNTATSYSFLVGTYTQESEQGINELFFSPSEGKMEIKLVAADVQNPSFVLANQANDLVFSLEEDQGQTGGNVMVFGRTSSMEQLEPIDTIASFGDHPCYLGLSPDEKLLAVGNYSGGSLSIFSITESAKLEHLQTIQHEGKSVNESRQEKAHVHSTVFSPDGKYLVVADLGTDKIYVYDIDASDSIPLSLSAEFPVTPGDGPRHMAFSKNGDELLVVQELTAELEVFDFQDGKLTSKQKLSLLDERFEGEVGAAEIRFSPDFQNVYASNRGDANTISVFTKEGNQYQKTQVISSGGIMPRNFNLTSDGKYVLVAHQESNDILVFDRDSASGMLSPTDWKVEVNQPVYLFPLKN